MSIISHNSLYPINNLALVHRIMLTIPTQHTACEDIDVEAFLDNEPLANRAKRLRKSKAMQQLAKEQADLQEPVVAPPRKRSKKQTCLENHATTPKYPLSVLHVVEDGDGRHLHAMNTCYEGEGERLYRNPQDLIDFSTEMLADSASGGHYGTGFDTGETWRTRANVLYFNRDLWNSLDVDTVRTLRSLGAAIIYTNASIPFDD